MFFLILFGVASVGTIAWSHYRERNDAPMKEVMIEMSKILPRKGTDFQMAEIRPEAEDIKIE